MLIFSALFKILYTLIFFVRIKELVLVYLNISIIICFSVLYESSKSRFLTFV